MKTLKIRTLFLLISFLTGWHAQASEVHGIWATHGRKWSDLVVPALSTTFTWEDACSEWIKKKVDTDNFDQFLPLFKDMQKPAATPDCGQAAALIHLECAMKFRLPYALHGKREYSNSTTKFDYITDLKKRKEEYIKFVILNSHPESLPEETYPTKINRAGVRPGSILLFLRGSPHNHTLTVKSIGPLGYVNFINSTMPAPINTGFIPTLLWLTFGIADEQQPFTPAESAFREWGYKDGFRNWRHYDETRGSFLPDNEEKLFSLEQYDESFNRFSDDNDSLPKVHKWYLSVLERMKLYDGEPIDFVDELQLAACKKTQNRINLVSEGEKLRLAKVHLDKATYDRYYTDDTDKNLKARFQELETYLSALPRDNQKDYLINYKNKQFAQCLISYSDDKTINLTDFELALLKDTVDSGSQTGAVYFDPNHSLDEKWGQPIKFSEGPEVE